MKKSVRRSIAAVVLLLTFVAMQALVFGVEFDQGGEAAPERAPDCDASWRTVPSAPEVIDARALAAIAPDDVWIVGSRRLGTVQPATAAEHWDGSSWTLVPTPNGTTGADSQNALNAVDAFGSEDAWAVGYAAVGDVSKTLVLHWDGAEWRAVPSPNVGDANTLTGVDAVGSDAAWAVGYHREGARRQTLIAHWDGVAWVIVPSPNPSPGSNALLDVVAVDDAEVWAVGYQSSRTGLRSLVLRHDGRTWQEVPVPGSGGRDDVLTSVAATPDGDVWAAGYAIDGAEHRTLTMHLEAGTWRVVLSPNPGDGATILRDLHAAAPDDVWAVGFQYRADIGAFVASTQRWDGSAWVAISSAIAQTRARSELLAVARAEGTTQVWAAGRLREGLDNVETICAPDDADAATDARAATGSPIGAPTTRSAPSTVSRIEASPSSSLPVWAPGGLSVAAIDQAAAAGIAEVTSTYGAVVADFDGDGSPDIFLGRHANLPRLYVNDGRGHFTETNEGTWQRGDVHGCATADVNQDGLTDIFCSVGAGRGGAVKMNRLHVQQTDRSFVDRPGEYNLFEPFARGRSAVFVDANGDPFPDLFLMNDSDRGDGLPSPNRLFLNEEGSGFRYAPTSDLEIEADGGHAVTGDIDQDGWQDLLVTGYPDDNARVSDLLLYRNQRGNGYTDVALSIGLGHRVIDATLVDVNGDTWLDVVELTPDELRVLLNQRGTFAPAFSSPVDFGLSVAAGDVNGDGRSDLYVLRGEGGGTTNAPDVVYLNDGSGVDFAQISSIPPASGGKAESVWPIDHDGNGLTDFIVLNGRDGADPGPVQLISFFPDQATLAAGTPDADQAASTAPSPPEGGAPSRRRARGGTPTPPAAGVDLHLNRRVARRNSLVRLPPLVPDIRVLPYEVDISLVPRTMGAPEWAPREPDGGIASTE